MVIVAAAMMGFCVIAGALALLGVISFAVDCVRYSAIIWRRWKERKQWQ